MNQCLKISIARGGCRFATPLYLGSSYILSFEGERSDEAKKVILTKPRSQNPDDTDGIVVLAQSVDNQDGVTLFLNRNVLVEWFKSNRACDVESSVDAHCYVFNEQGDVIADSPVTIEYSTTLFIIDNEDYPLAREVLLQAASARNEACAARDEVEKAKQKVEKARDKAEKAKTDAEIASSAAKESAEISSVASKDAITAKNAAQNAQIAAEENAVTAKTALEKMVASVRKVVGGVEVLLWNGQGYMPEPIFIPNGVDGVNGYVKCDEDNRYYCIRCKEVDGEKVLTLEQVGVDNVSVEGYVRAVNGTTPDAAGNVNIPIDFLPLSGNWNNPITGTVAFNVVSARICNRHTKGGVVINGGGGNTDGGSLYLQHKDSSSNPGGFGIYTSDGTTTKGFVGTKEGILKWDGKNIIRSINGNVADTTGNIIIPFNFLPLTGGDISGDIKFTKNSYLKKKNNTGFLNICGGTGLDDGASIVLRGKTYDSESGWFFIKSTDGAKSCALIGKPDGTLTWGGKNVAFDGDFMPMTLDGERALLPVGAVFAFAVNNTTPSGCLICNGAAVSRSKYSRLWVAIGTTYGKGDGSTTFNLPDLRNKFIQGSETAGEVKEAGLPNIKGTFSGILRAGADDADSPDWDGAMSKDKEYSAGNGGGNNRPYYSAKFDASKSDAIYGSSDTVQPPALTMRYFIKY